ncbi:MAG: hypothetical protein JSV20_02050 [Candidatus Bathyarchaeota archaeon]|nr:MAG: hypothetical protein JSV20_02050 [Candidatus Bathyarchaeota archaeon]
MVKRQRVLKQLHAVLDNGAWHTAEDIAHAAKLTRHEVAGMLRGDEHVERKTQRIKAFGKRYRLTLYRLKPLKDM